jgi:hypothetical protein
MHHRNFILFFSPRKHTGELCFIILRRKLGEEPVTTVTNYKLVTCMPVSNNRTLFCYLDHLLNGSCLSLFVLCFSIFALSSVVLDDGSFF